MYIEHIEDLPAEALAVLKANFSEETDFESVDGICELIRECNDDYDETTDSCYITCTYHMTIGGWRFEVDGNSYRKDQSVCDEELDDGFAVISLEQQKKDKISKKKAERAKSDEKWRTLVSSVEGTMEPEDVFNMLKDYKFPKKW
jgi:hypothetical protein